VSVVSHGKNEREVNVLTCTVVESVEESEQRADGEDVVVLVEVRHFGEYTRSGIKEQQERYE